MFFLTPGLCFRYNSDTVQSQKPPSSSCSDISYSDLVANLLEPAHQEGYYSPMPQYPFDTKAVVACLNRILESELSGVIRYTHYSFMVFGINRLPIVSVFDWIL